MYFKSCTKKSVLAGILLLLLLGVGLWQAAPALANSYPGVINEPAANVRSGPGVGYAPVAVVYQGYSVTLLERNSSLTWVKVRTSTGNAEGWVNASFISTSADMATLPVTSLQTIEAIALVNQIKVNIRAGDSIEYVSLGTVGLDQRVAILGRNFNGAWAKVRVVSTGLIGWINTGTITPSDLSAYPVVVSPPLTTANSAAAAAAAAANAAATGSTAIVTAGNLNVRRGDNASAQIVASLSRDTVVTLIGRNSSSNWAFIRTPSGQEGWVNANYLRYDPGIYNLPVRNADGSLSGGNTTTTASTSTTASTLTSVGNVITVNTDVLSVYSGPGSSYDSFAMVFWGQTLILVGRSADGAWVKVQDATGAQGWVSAASITSSLPIAQAGVVN